MLVWVFICFSCLVLGLAPHLNVSYMGFVTMFFLKHVAGSILDLSQIAGMKLGNFSTFMMFMSFVIVSHFYSRFTTSIVNNSYFCNNYFHLFVCFLKSFGL